MLRQIRLLVVPTEHGGWGFLIFPCMLGLLISPSWGGASLSLAAFATFLLRQPLKLATKDILRRKVYPRTKWAIVCAFVLAGCALSMLAESIHLSNRPFLGLLIAALALGGAQFVLDLQGQGRTLLAEFAGAVGLSFLVGMILIADGRTGRDAAFAMSALALQSIGAIVYVRARLAEQKEEKPQWLVPFLLHLGFAALACTVSVWVALLYVLLAIRAGFGASGKQKQVKPAFVGLQEFAYSFLTVVVTTAAVRAGM